MRRKILTVPKDGYDGMKGFTIVEFLVAGLLSMIVLMAVGSSYFTSRKLNDAANNRLSAQQDLRNAATLIVRDARMAGNFGCFNMAVNSSKAVVFDKTEKDLFFALKKGNLDKLIPVAESTDIKYPGFSQSGKALIFQYGIDDLDASAETVVVSSCSAIAKPGKKISTLGEAKSELNITDDKQNGNITRQKHEVNAYAVGSISGEEGLFRFQLKDNGQWGNPQLLVKKINKMDIRYIYVSDCPLREDDGKVEKFKYTDTFDTSQAAVTPAEVEILLNSGKFAASADNEVYAYRINATIRGGNVCANRTL
ncbi:PilW family protein [Neisseria sp. Marseille-Q6792]|uniref:PilW family protein n=1 Tax=Neisseria sp. Marseille-Q6792 TaxID=2937985 RepID=UPI002024C991|nr:PilW family protein [Neisseria sp. Marseille-Q6792]